MPRTRIRSRLRPLAAILAGAAVLAGLVASCGDARPAAPSANFGAVVPPGRVVPGTRLVDQDGRTVNLASFRGRYLVIAEFLTLCQEECPITTGALESMEQAVRRAGMASQVAFVEITMDPGRDTPARLQAYRSQFGVDWTLLTGTPDDIAALWKHFGIFYQKVPEGSPPGIDWWTHQPLTYDVEHSNGFMLVDRAGNERFVTQEMPDLRGKLPAGLERLLDDQGRTNLAHPQPGLSYTVPQAVDALSWLVGRKLSVPGAS